jgi:hypothetical protein
MLEFSFAMSPIRCDDGCLQPSGQHGDMGVDDIGRA